jgi:ribosomal protein L35AE/L33A
LLIHRLYVRGKHVSFTRGKRNSKPNTSLIKIEGCDSIQDAEFYLGKRIAYVYKVFPFHKRRINVRHNEQSEEAKFESSGER